jgi:hypothetical protein
MVYQHWKIKSAIKKTYFTILELLFPLFPVYVIYPRPKTSVSPSFIEEKNPYVTCQFLGDDNLRLLETGWAQVGVVASQLTGSR